MNNGLAGIFLTRIQFTKQILITKRQLPEPSNEDIDQDDIRQQHVHEGQQNHRIFPVRICRAEDCRI